jgi:hypothetical protein
MDISRPVPTHAIESVTQLADGHPVFLVRLQNGAFVLKAEDSSSNRQVADPASIMNAVDPRAQSRVLKKDEIMRIRDWVAGHPQDVEEQNAGDLLGRLRGALRPPMPMAGIPGGMMPQQNNVIVIMQAKQNLQNLEAAGTAALGGDKTAVKRLATALNQPGGLEKLGEILAADAFTGNQDRVNFEGAGKMWNGAQLQCLQNPGNVFVGDEQGRPTVLGLDTFDPTNQFSRMEDWQDASDGFFYPGQLLRNDAGNRRAEVIQKVVADIETILGRRNRKIPGARKSRLPADAAQRIDRGMMNGAAKILAHLRQQYAPRGIHTTGSIPQGLRNKLEACGWLTPANFPNRV